MASKPCLILTDKTVHNLLIDLKRDEIITFLNSIGSTLGSFSVGNERPHQPEPTTIVRNEGRKHLFRPFTSASNVGIKIIVDPRKALASQSTKDQSGEERQRLMGLHGIVAVCDINGFPNGFINAEELTGYRTTLSAMLLYVRRKETQNMVVFGAGKQALWHIRIALGLRGEEIEKITVVNRSMGRLDALVKQIKEENDERWKANVAFESVHSNDQEMLQSALAEADVVFCTTPSNEILFPAGSLRKMGSCYISAIGSWSKDMIELDPELLKTAAGRDEEKGLVVVDDREECRKNAGEIVQSGLSEDKVVEVGEVLDLIEGSDSELRTKTVNCLECGLVVYKSVGVSLTDLAAGQALLDLAWKKNVGTVVADF